MRANRVKTLWLFVGCRVWTRGQTREKPAIEGAEKLTGWVQAHGAR
jgi:hypothetical protein